MTKTAKRAETKNLLCYKTYCAKTKHMFCIVALLYCFSV